jgi:hypothetical protein
MSDEALTIKTLDCQSFQTAQAQSHRSAGQTHFGGAVVGLVNAMAEHGHVDDALAYLNDPLPGDCFPLHFVNNLARECRDDETRLKTSESGGASMERTCFQRSRP